VAECVVVRGLALSLSTGLGARQGQGRSRQAARPIVGALALGYRRMVLGSCDMWEGQRSRRIDQRGGQLMERREPQPALSAARAKGPRANPFTATGAQRAPGHISGTTSLLELE